MREVQAAKVWGYEHPFSPRRALLGALLTFALVAAVAWAVLGLALSLVLPDGLAVLVAAIVAVAGVATLAWRRYQSFGRAISTSDPSPGNRRRVEALIEGLQTQIGLARARVAFVDSSAVNAAALPNGTVVVTTGALAKLEATELEALLARELVALRFNLVRGYGLLAAAGRLRASDLVRREAAMLDIAAVSVTRFPPAMASLLAQASTEADSGLARVVPAWLWAFPVAEDSGNSDLELRWHLILDEIWTVGVSRPRHT
jgi:Zn-dependent protease with chaperone function